MKGSRGKYRRQPNTSAYAEVMNTGTLYAILQNASDISYCERTLKMTQRKRLEKNLNRVKQMDAQKDCLFLETNIC